MIEISALTKRYGSLTVLDGIDFRVGTGEIAAVVGPSGAGKSTLARCVNLLERPTSGTITVDGQDLTRLRGTELRSRRRQIGSVFQSAALLHRLTAADNVALPLRYTRLTPAERHARVRELLDRVGMLHRSNHYPSQLSGGQQQRIGLARGLVLKPSVLLADEPTSGLDPDTTHSILTLLKELRDDLQVAVVLITHEMDAVRAAADTVAQLDHGRIVESGPVNEVVRRSDSALATALLPSPPTETGTHTTGQTTYWALRYEDARVDPAWLSTVSRELDSNIALHSALVETVGGSVAGRAVVSLERDRHDDTRIIDAFATRGIAARRTAAATTPTAETAATAAATAADAVAEPTAGNGATHDRIAA